MVFFSSLERARDYLHKTGRFIVIGGIVSPVHDSYGKQVGSSLAPPPRPPFPHQTAQRPSLLQFLRAQHAWHPASHPWTTIRPEQLGVGLHLGGTAARAQATAHSAGLKPHSLMEEQAHLPRARAKYDPAWIPN